MGWTGRRCRHGLECTCLSIDLHCGGAMLPIQPSKTFKVTNGNIFLLLNNNLGYIKKGIEDKKLFMSKIQRSMK
jgi:hypothetical protein